MDIKKYFKLKEIHKEDEYILLEMKSIWDYINPIYNKQKLKLNKDTLAAIYFLEISKNGNNKIIDCSSDIFDFIRDNFIWRLPDGYDSSIDTLEYKLTYYNNNKEYNIELIQESIPNDIKEWVNNIIKVHSISDVYYYDKDLLNIILRIHNGEQVCKSEIKQLINDYDYYYYDEFSNMIDQNIDNIPIEELTEKIYNHLISTYSK